MNNIPKLVEAYQCAGCVGDGEECFKKDIIGIGCSKHCAGTRGSPNIGRFLLGVPKGFNRYGINEKTYTLIFEDLKQKIIQYPYNKFNLPVWKYLDRDVCFIRGLMPRVNEPFLHIIGNISKEDFEDIRCLEITKEDVEEMD